MRKISQLQGVKKLKRNNILKYLQSCSLSEFIEKFKRTTYQARGMLMLNTTV